MLEVSTTTKEAGCSIFYQVVSNMKISSGDSSLSFPFSSIGTRRAIETTVLFRSSVHAMHHTEQKTSFYSSYLCKSKEKFSAISVRKINKFVNTRPGRSTTVAFHEFYRLFFILFSLSVPWPCSMKHPICYWGRPICIHISTDKYLIPCGHSCFGNYYGDRLRRQLPPSSRTLQAYS